MNFLILFLAGFFVGPIGDFAHVATKTTAYPDSYAFYLFGLPWWVPLLFGSAALSVGASHSVFDRWLGAPTSRPGSRSWKSVIGGLTVFVGLYVLSGLLPGNAGGLNDVVLAFGAIAVWIALDRTWQGAVLALATAITGSMVEIFLVRQGVFHYREHAANLFGVASWLPWLYVAASVTIANLARKLNHSSR